MRSRASYGYKRFGRFGWIECVAVCMMVSMLIVDEARSNNAYSIKMFVAKNSTVAETSSATTLSVFSNTAYYVRVDWKEPTPEGSNNNHYDVVIREILEDGNEELIAQQHGIADDLNSLHQSKVLVVNTSEYSDALVTGTHNIYAQVRRHGMSWEPEEDEYGELPSDCKSTVYEVSLYYLLNNDSGGWRWGGETVCKGETVSFKASILPVEATAFPDGGWPKWEDYASGESDEANPITLTFNTLGTKTVTVQVGPGSESVSVYVKEVEFMKYLTQDYGFDDWTDREEPWKSIKNGQTDTAIAEIVRSPVSDVYFKSVTESDVTLSPSQANSNPQITFTAVSSGWSEIQANDGSVSGTNLAKMNVKVYDEATPAKKVLIKIVRLPGQAVGSPFGETELENYLNNEIYNQCVTKFEVDWDSPSYCEVNYDSTATGGNEDGKLNRLDDDECDKIIADAALTSSYDVCIYVVKDIDDALGFFVTSTNYVFVEEDVNTLVGAHEIGHWLDLDHIEGDYYDDENLMSTGYWTNDSERLRKTQWDTVNP